MRVLRVARTCVRHDRPVEHRQFVVQDLGVIAARCGHVERDDNRGGAASHQPLVLAVLQPVGRQHQRVRTTLHEYRGGRGREAATGRRGADGPRRAGVVAVVVATHVGRRLLRDLRGARARHVLHFIDFIESTSQLI